MNLNKYITYFFIVLFGSVSIESYGQNKFLGQFENEHSQTFLSLRNDRLQLDAKADSILSNWMTQGFIGASLDSSFEKNDTLYYQFYKGKAYSWNQFEIPNASRIVKNIGLNDIDNEPIDLNKLQSLLDRMLNKCAEKGYPFAKAQLKNIVIESNVIKANLQLDLNELFTYDSLIIKGDAKVGNLYLANVLDVRSGEAYNEFDIRNIGKKLKEVPFVKETSTSQFVFKKGMVDTYVYLSPKKANRFNGIIGFLPNSSTGKTNFTGEIDLSLINTFKAGERLDFEWRRIQENVQELSVVVSVPYLFNSPFGVEADIEIFRRDTIFLEVQNQLGLIYNFGSGDFFKAYYKSYNSDNLGNDSNGNPRGGTSYDSYGLGLNYSELDYKFNPRKGYNIFMTADVGQKFFKSNTFVDSVAGDIPEKSTIYTLSGTAQLYIPSGKRSTLMLSASGSTKLNPYLISNELYRFGGINSLRGFDENGLTASSFLYFTAEYRLLTDLNSNLFLFANSGFLERELIESYDRDIPYGFGVGANFDTKAGIFSISYALGSEQGNAISLKQAKVHFGFKSLF